MKEMTKLTFQKAANGYVIQPYNPYGSDGDPTIYSTFEDAVTFIAEAFGETSFSATLRESQDVARALSGFSGKVIAPQLTAIEAKINPGIENLVTG